MHAQQNAHAFSNNSSDCSAEPSPAFASADYFNMMQHMTEDEQSNHSGLGGLDLYNNFQEHGQMYGGMHMEPSSEYQDYGFPQAANDMFDSPQDMNRRTLTQEQFDAFAHQPDMLQGSNEFDAFDMFSDFNNGHGKAQDAFAFPAPMGAPMSSHDSSIPSTISEQSSMGFPSAHAMQEQATMSSTSSEWTGSRSSSISTVPREDSFPQQIHAPQPQSIATPWRPGQSVPVDFNQLSQEFKQAAQARQQPHFHAEQPLAWPSDEAYHQREGSQTAMITQSLSNIGIQTPQPQQNATFKSPTPAASLAARRQRARPTPLGLASLRSQSYSGAMQPGSPGQMPQPHNLTPGQPLRRIKSSNVMNGFAQGRIQKQNPGSAQRSPLNWTFTDAMASPKVLRHASSQSSSNLAPPTPRSPSKEHRLEQARQMQQWQSSVNQTSRQASISESDYEQSHPTHGPPAPVQTFSSPPHTPLYPPQPQFVQQHRAGQRAVTENTPPQSAPATQQCFPANAFNPAAPKVQHQATSTSQPPPSQQAMQHMFSVHPDPPAPAPAPAPEPQYQMMNMSASQNPQFTITTSGPMEMPMQFPPGGVPIVDENGNLQMAIPQQQYQFLHHPMSHAPPSTSAAPQGQVLMQTPPMMQYPFFSNTSPSPGMQVAAQMPKPPPQPQAEFFVHEYQPPEDVKRAATPRKGPADNAPKNYTFANQTLEHFQKNKKGEKATAESASGHSPASSSGAASSS